MAPISENEFDRNAIRAWLRKHQKPEVIVTPAYVRMSTATAISGICQQIIQEHIKLYETTGGKQGLRSYKIKGREGRKGTRLMRLDDLLSYIPTILVDAAELGRQR